MTKRELINLLEANPTPDDTEVMKSYWEGDASQTGREALADIYEVRNAFDERYDGKMKKQQIPVIKL